NNSLASMITVISTAAQETSDSDMAEALTVCERRCRNMGAFITKFASAVKIPEPVRVNVDLTYMLRSWLPTFESICATTGARFTMTLPEYEIMVMIDSVQIEQALINIVKNAAESTGEGGEVSLKFEKQGPTITITDNGPGISPEASGMLFVPFFTTKPSGHGFGLLLVSEVLNAHQCRFSLETASDGLTRFRIRFV
ncbi:MAG: HAMP domain-containing histidine kinase, partial [Muribaculaceae bacterium]|nr:HAMP domain-containing histidine kinase [Muribaculaceae bacterium]